MSLDRRDALPSGIAIQVRGHRAVEIAEQNDLRISDEDLLDRHPRGRAEMAATSAPPGELDVEIVIGAGAQLAQGVSQWRAQIEHTRPPLRRQDRGRGFDLGQALLLALAELGRTPAFPATWPTIAT